MTSELEELNANLSDLPPLDVVRRAVEFGGDRTIVSTNFRPHEAVILHLATRVRPDIPVLWVDTGYNTPETYLFAEKVIELLNLNVRLYLPKRSRAHRDAVNGGIPDIDDQAAHDAFTKEVKLEPFFRGLDELQPKVWLTALRASQTEHRQNLGVVSMHDDAIYKVSPVYRFSDRDMEDYLAEHGLPDETNYYDPTKVLEKRECGLHLNPT